MDKYDIESPQSVQVTGLRTFYFAKQKVFGMSGHGEFNLGLVGW
jgi:hypothetical protein